MKKILLFVLTLFLSLTMVSCGNTEVKGEVIVSDLLERQVQVNPGKYERVVCIGAGALRMYSYVGDVSKLAAVEDIDNEAASNRPVMFDGVARPYFIAFKDNFKNLLSCGKGGPQSQTIEQEKILACNPDIIISEYEDKDKADKLSKDLNLPVIVISYGSQGVFDAKCQQTITLLGKIFDKNEKAKTLNDFINNNKADIQNRVKDIDKASQKKVYICGLGNWGTANYLSTTQNYAVFDVAKINNVVTGLTVNKIHDITKEKFEELAPSMDVMIFDAASIKNIKKLYAENPNLFKNSKAFKNGEMYLQMAYNAYYTNLEIALANAWYNAKVVYPQLFSDIDIETKLNEITNAFLGKELASQIYAYQFSYGGYKKISEEIFK